MRPFTPQGDPPGQPPASARRPSFSGTNFRRSSGSSSALPRPQTSLRDSRIATIRGASTTQPSYNIFTGEGNQGGGGAPTANPMRRSTSRQSVVGGGPSPPRAGRGGTAGAASSTYSRESSKENMAPPDAEHYEAQRRQIEELKAELGTMQYNISTHEQEKEMARLAHENEVREVRRSAEDDFKARQAAEAECAKATRLVEELQRQVEELRAEKEAREHELEARAREAESEVRLVQEQLDDLSSARDEAARIADRRIAELEGQTAAANRTAQELEHESQTREALLQSVQSQLLDRQEAMGKVEAELLSLKAVAGDAQTMDAIKTELVENVTRVRTLEATGRAHEAELKHLRQVHKAVEVVEEEKRSLQRKLEAAAAIETELTEERRQRIRLEDERRAWTAYLQSESSGEDQIEFDSPEAMARAFLEERYKSAELLEKLGEVQPQLTDRDNLITELEMDKARLNRDIEELKSTAVSASPDKVVKNLERQLASVKREVQFLRDQLNGFYLEDATVNPGTADEKKAERIRELEGLVDSLRSEVQNLNSQVSQSTSTPLQPAPSAGTKRPRPDDAEESERLGQLNRKLRKLQDELSAQQTSYRLLEREHAITKEQLGAAKEQNKTRVLSLRSNPTSDHEAVKAATLAALKLENAELLAHIQRQPTLFATVPASQLAAAQREIADAKAETASAHKTASRLKQVWSAKSAEFKEAIFSTLGWTVTFIPNGKMRVESVFYPSTDPDEHENSIVFDGERGTMKVGGGPRSKFAARIAQPIQYWVRDKGCIPGFLAALTLEFFEASQSGRDGETMTVSV